MISNAWKCVPDNTSDVVYRFRGEYSFLSNFYPAKIVFNDFVWMSVEHVYQAIKCQNVDDFLKIRYLKDIVQVKKISNIVEKRKNWDMIKHPIMESLLVQKFIYNKELLDKLRLTGKMLLVEGNYWHDNFWGHCFCGKCDKNHDNYLGLLLADIRDDNYNINDINYLCRRYSC